MASNTASGGAVATAPAVFADGPKKRGCCGGGGCADSNNNSSSSNHNNNNNKQNDNSTAQPPPHGKSDGAPKKPRKEEKEEEQQQQQQQVGVVAKKKHIVVVQKKKKPMMKLKPGHFYRRKLPETCTPYDSAAGEKLFRSAYLAGFATCHFHLMAQFRTQDEPSYVNNVFVQDNDATNLCSVTIATLLHVRVFSSSLLFCVIGTADLGR